MENTKKFPLWAKIVCIVLAVIIFIAAALGITFVAVWHNEISTVSSFKKIRSRNDSNDEGSVYSMEVKGGFYFDDFLKQGGVSSDSELIGFILDNITRGMGGMLGLEIGETDIGCSAFTAVAENGDILFGRNYDFDLTNTCITVCNNPGKGRYKSFSTVDLNYVGMDPEKDVTGLMNKVTCLASTYAPLDGINEKGLSCGIFMSYQGNVRDENNVELTTTVATDQKDADKKNITSTTMLRMVLDCAATVDEAVELIGEYNLHDSANTSFHYMLADATGRSAVLEWVPADDGVGIAGDRDGSERVLKVIYNDDARYSDPTRTYEYRGDASFKYQWITNFILHDGYYNDDLNKRGLDRYQKIYGALNGGKGGVKDERAAMDILAGVGRRTFVDSVSHSTGVTVHSVVYNLTKKTVMWVPNENYGDENAYYGYSFKSGKFVRV